MFKLVLIGCLCTFTYDQSVPTVLKTNHSIDLYYTVQQCWAVHVKHIYEGLNMIHINTPGTIAPYVTLGCINNSTQVLLHIAASSCAILVIYANCIKCYFVLYSMLCYWVKISYKRKCHVVLNICHNFYISNRCD